METNQNQNSKMSILPKEGIIRISDLAMYLELSPTQLQKKLEEQGIKFLSLGKHYSNKIIRLEDL